MAKDDASLNINLTATDDYTKSFNKYISAVDQLHKTSGDNWSAGINDIQNAFLNVGVFMEEHTKLSKTATDILVRDVVNAGGGIADVLLSIPKNYASVITTLGVSITEYTTRIAISIAETSDKVARFSMQFAAIGDNYNGFYRDLAKSTGTVGVSINELTEDVSALGNAGFRGSSKDMAVLVTQMHQFTQVTGISTGTVAEFTANVSRFGKVGVETAKGLLDDFSDIRKTFQMSASEADTLFESTHQATMAIFAFSSATDPGKIKSAAMEVSKFGGMMLHVGMSSESTNKILGAMFDPTKWRENAFLMTQMGYSMGDMQKALIGGEMPKASKMFGSLQATAKEFYDRSRGNVFVMEKMASTLGITTQELARLGKMSQEEVNATKALQDSQESLQDSWKKLGTFMTQMKILFNSLTGIILSALTPAIQTIGIVLAPVIKAVQWFSKLIAENAFMVEFIGTTMTWITGIVLAFAAAMGIAAIANSTFIATALPIILPILAVGAAITLLIMGVKALFKYIEAKSGIFSSLWEGISMVMEGIGIVASSVFGVIGALLTGLIQGLKIGLFPLIFLIETSLKLIGFVAKLLFTGIGHAVLGLGKLLGAIIRPLKYVAQVLGWIVGFTVGLFTSALAIANIVPMIVGFLDNIVALVLMMASIFTGLGGHLLGFVFELGAKVVGFINGIFLSAMDFLWSGLKGLVGGVFGMFKSIASGIGNFFKSIWNNILDGAISALNKMISYANWIPGINMKLIGADDGVEGSGVSGGQNIETTTMETIESSADKGNKTSNDKKTADENKELKEMVAGQKENNSLMKTMLHKLLTRGSAGGATTFVGMQ